MGSSSKPLLDQWTPVSSLLQWSDGFPLINFLIKSIALLKSLPTVFLLTRTVYGNLQAALEFSTWGTGQSGMHGRLLKVLVWNSCL
jgi:hypothetical protein